MSVISSPSIKTDRLIIEPFTEDLLTEKYVSWLNDPIVVRYSGQRHKIHTLEECRKYYLSLISSDNIFLSVKLKEASHQHIGNLTISIDVINSVADIAILIGDRNVWGDGYGFECWKAMCDFLIMERRIRKVTGGCYATHEAMKKIMIKSGMVFDGERKSQVLVNEVPVDIVYFALFNPSFIVKEWCG